MEAVLKIENMTFKYPNSQKNIFENFNLNLNKGEFVSILGKSGSGKSTFLRILAGLENISSREFIKSNIDISYMPQRDSLLPWRNILENITLPAEIAGENRCIYRKKGEKILEELGLEKWENNYPFQLSGGMRQRVSFARTLMKKGDLILLDEPFSALDAINKIKLREWLKGITKNLDKTFLFVTHDIDEAIELSDRIFLIEQIPIKKFKEYVLNDYRSMEDKIFLKNEILSLIKGEKNEY